MSDNLLNIINPDDIKGVKSPKFHNPTDFNTPAIDPEEDDGMSTLEKIGVSARAAWKDTVEYSAFEKLIYESGVLEADGNQEPTIDPKFAKEDSGLELDAPVTPEQYYILKNMREEKIEMEDQLGEAFSLDEPIDAALAFGTYMALSMFTPIAHISGTAVGALAGSAIPVVGTAVGGLVGLSGSVAYRASRAVRMAKTYSKIAKQMKKARSLVNSTGLASKAQKAAKFMTNSKLKRAALAGATGNSLEESAIWWLEASKGHNTNLGARASFGFFAPLLFTAGVSVIAPPVAKAFRAIRQKSFSKDARFRKAGDTAVVYDTKKAVEEIKVELDKKGDADELFVRRRLNEVASNAESTEDYLDALGAIFKTNHKGLREAIGIFGDEAFDKKIIDLYMGMMHAEVRPDLFELFPFLRNVDSLNSHLELTAKRLGLDPKTADYENLLDEVLKLDPKEFGKYVNANHRPKDTPNKRGKDLEPQELKEINSMKEDTAALEKFRGNSLWDDFVKFNDEIINGIDGYVKCLTDGIEVAPSGKNPKKGLATASVGKATTAAAVDKTLGSADTKAILDDPFVKEQLKGTKGKIVHADSFDGQTTLTRQNEDGTTFYIKKEKSGAIAIEEGELNPDVFKRNRDGSVSLKNGIMKDIEKAVDSGRMTQKEAQKFMKSIGKKLSDRQKLEE